MSRTRKQAVTNILLSVNYDEEKDTAMNIALLSVVALLEDLSAQGLVRGQVGTVLENWAPDVYEVEFSDESGRSYATVALKANQRMLLHHEPALHRH